SRTRWTRKPTWTIRRSSSTCSSSRRSSSASSPSSAAEGPRVNAAASAKLPGLVRCAVRGWIDDDASSMGAALAFYTLFSLAPLLLVAIAVAGMFIGRGEAQSLLLAQVALLVGDNAAAGVEIGR